MAAVIQNLRQSPFFAGLDDEALQDIASYVHERTFSAGQVIVAEGERCQAVYLVVHGVVRVRRLSPEGREQVLAYLGAGESFNLVPSLDGEPNPSTVDAVLDSTLYAIPCPRFRLIMRQHHQVALAVLEHLAAEVRRLGNMVEELALYTVRTRLARFLLTSAEDGHPPRHWTQEEIATHIGTVREMVGRTLRTFADEGLIRRERGRIVVADRDALEQVARAAD